MQGEKADQNQNDSYRIIRFKNRNGDECELRPSEEQLKIITSEMRQDLKIIACAGSGKTTTLVARLKYLIDQGVKPETIIISTFNVEAGKNIQYKANQILGSSSLLTIGNIDKIAFSMYTKYIQNKPQQSQIQKKFGLSVKEYCFELFKFLQTKEGIKLILDRYKYFFFDEFQDVNQLQYDILMLFKKHGCFLIVIGDDAQNIYGWRDSKIDIIQYKIDEDIQKFQGSRIKTFILSTNYRCSKQITLFSNEIISNSTNLIQKSMQYLESDGVQIKPYLQCFKNLYRQNDEIIAQIKLKLKRYSLRDIAIICPTNQPLKFFEEALEKHNLKYEQQLLYKSQIGSNYLDSRQNHSSGQNKEAEENKITLTTIHQSKGLEWKIVFFIGINDEFFPTNFIRDPSQSLSKLEECRRLFYVGCTRAINELYFGMIKTDKCHKVCRFFGGIRQDLYERDLDITENDLKFNYENISIKVERDNSITKIIEQFNHSDLNELEKIFEGIKEEKFIQVHPFSTLNQSLIKSNNLFIDIGLYIDLYIQRTIAEKLKGENGYFCEPACRVLFTMWWVKPHSALITKYVQFFSNKSMDFIEIESAEEFIDCFIVFFTFSSVDKINKNFQLSTSEVSLLKEIYKIICDFLISNNISYSLIQHVEVDEQSPKGIKEYFPEDYPKQNYVKSYKRFSSESVKTDDILFDIYQMSKCSQLLDMTRKVLYRDDFQAVHPKNIEQNVDCFVQYLKLLKYQRIRMKLIVKHGLHLQGEIDFIADDTIYEVKASQFPTITKEYILQTLAYAALLKVSKSQDIKKIVFYNPLIGKLTQYDISEWRYAQELIKFLVQKSGQLAECKRSEQAERQDGSIEIINKINNFSSPMNDTQFIQEIITTSKLDNEKVNSKPLFNIDQFKQPNGNMVGNKSRTPVAEYNIKTSKNTQNQFCTGKETRTRELSYRNNIQTKQSRTQLKKHIESNQITYLKKNIFNTRMIHDSDDNLHDIVHNSKEPCLVGTEDFISRGTSKQMGILIDGDEIEDYESFCENVVKKQIKTKNKVDDIILSETSEGLLQEFDLLKQIQPKKTPITFKVSKVTEVIQID